MEGAEALLGPAEPVRTEMVHGSGRTQVTRMFFAGGTVIRKEPLGPDAERRLAHETAVLVRLRGVAGVARLAEGLRYPGSVVLVDAGETSLAGLAEPLAPDDLIRLALRLAGAVAGMHRREVIHRDITPANIVLSADGEPCLVDFALAMSPAEIRPEVTLAAAVPILSRGLLRAVLLLENRLIRGAFTAGRLDAVQLIAGQLAVSLDNAQLYADFRRIADEQATLRRVATLVAQGAPPDQVFAAVAEEAGRWLRPTSPS